MDPGFMARRARALRDPQSGAAYNYALEAYGLSPSIYYAQKGKGKKVTPADTEMVAERLREACTIFDAQEATYRGDRDHRTRHARAYFFLAINQGTLGRSEASRKASVRAAEVLGDWMKDPPALEQAKLAVQVCRSLADSVEPRTRGSADHLRQMLLHTRRGLSLLRRYRVPDGMRLRALLLRGAGSAEARRRPHTERWLLRGERHLAESAALLEKIEKKTEGHDTSTAKAYRELGRVRRSLYRHYREGNPKRAAWWLDAAEVQIRKAIAAGPKRGGESLWDHYHMAKILRDRGDDEAALKECATAVGAVEADFAGLGRDENKVAFLTDKLPIYDFAVHMAYSRGLMTLAHEFAQRAKARIFIGRLTQRLPERFPESVIKDISALFESGAGQEALEPGDAIVEYHAGRHAVTMFVQTAFGMTVRRVPIPIEVLRESVDYVLGVIRDASIRGEGWWRGGLRDLADLVIDPIEDLLGGAKRLIIVPSGPLMDVPFCALQLKDGTHAIERWGFCYLPHSALLRQKPALTTSGRFLALADSQGDLFDAQLEADEAAKGFKQAKVLRGPDAQKKKLVELGSGARIIHLACHGRYDKDDPRSPYINLAGKTPEERSLTVGDILSLKLRGLDLAFLSGCNTARAVQLGGDEMEGVFHAFLQAGARSVVACLWDIEDKATRGLVGGFYERLRKGDAKWIALREAQLESLRQNPHPYYWGAFKLIGGGE